MDHEHQERQPAQRRRRRRKQSTGKRIAKIIGTLMLVFVLTCCFFAGIFMTYVNTTLSKEASLDMSEFTSNQTSFIYYMDKDTGQWEELQTLKSEVNRIEVTIDQIPQNLQDACVAIEDARFYTHKGVDWKRTAGAVVNMFFGMRNTFGGSTITQQLIKNLTGDKEGTVKRKVTEIFRALDLEKRYEKREILEMYLNEIFLGYNCYGVQSASQYYFGKDVSQLSLAECASLIGITNNPWVYDPLRNEKSLANNQSRKETILSEMLDQGYITQEEYDGAMAEKVVFTEDATEPEDDSDSVEYNSYFVDQVIRDVSADLAEKLDISEKAARHQLYYNGYKIYTTIDPEIQSIAESVFEDRANADYTSRKGQPLHSGITIVEPSTGNVVAMVGDIGKKEGDLVWNWSTTVRQCGSSIKPIATYAPALDSGVITMASVLDNSPVQLLNGKPWPKNSNGTYSGLMTLSAAVAGSVNAVAVRVNQMLGVSNSYSFLENNLGITTLVDDDLNLSALGLGGLTYGVTTEQMAAAFASFANDGVYNKPRLYVEVRDSSDELVLENPQESQVAMKETTAYFMNKLLKGVISGGTGGGAYFPGMTIAGKTGTTSDNYDRYFVGYTPYYSAAVWCGYKENEKIISSVNPSAALWRKVMSKVHEGLSNKDFSKPSSGLVTVQVCRDSGLLATDACAHDIRGESRIQSVEVAKGTEPTETCNLHTEIQYCTEGKCIAGEYCPEDTVTTVSVLDYTRDSFGASVADTPYLLGTLEAAAEAAKTASGTPCTVHTTAPEPPPPEEGGEGGGDPSGSGGEGEDPNGGSSSGGNTDEPGGGGDNWFDEFWGPSEPSEPTQ
ncbi:PBP1A family penicillin-binding protein [Oscillibacter hominis]|uniref:Penicillin-binding protein 1A n=1 Tax=Oscillibacter hominis TaxID=2763056 RepID=A0A7G9B1E7_9FIRM|nr:PBP1A family penicillin-binding protein [Oscillibacter hominis]QNL43378.1 PBP1A family penicillin-binding protein [Oscillibacter hominis]